MSEPKNPPDALPPPDDLLQMAEANLALIALQSMGDAVIVTDKTGLVTQMNPSAETLTGWSLIEARGCPLADIFQTNPTITDVQIQTEIGPYTQRTLLFARDGSQYTIAQNIAPILDAKGLMAGTVRVFRDVSTEEQVQEKLARATELLERTGELAKIGGWEIDLSTMKLLWTRETYRIAEIESSYEPTLEQGIQLFPSDARPIITAAIQHTIDTGTPYDLELPLISFKGRDLWVRTQGFAVMENGKTIKLRGTFQDISESRKTQQALKTSEARFRSIFDASLVPLALNDDQLNITAVNPAFVQAFGYTREDIPSLADWWPKAYPDESYRRQAMDLWQTELLRSQQAGDAFKPIEFHVCCKDGSCKTVLVNATPLSDDFKGTHLVMLYDISARKQAEDELQANRGQLANMIDTAMDAIISTDTNFKIVLFNRAAEQLFGYSANQMLGQSINMLIPLQLAAGHDTFMRQFAAHGETTRRMGSKSARQVAGLRADGSEFPVEVSISYSDNYGNPLFTAMVRDITERIEHETELLQLATTLEIRVAERTHELEEAKQLAEQANRAKSTFLANMSHEIRTPLNSVLGMAYLAQQQASDPKQQDYLHKITLSGNHLLGLINDILDFSKIGAGKFVLDQVDFDLIEMLSVLRKMLQQKINEKNLELRISIEKSLPPLRRGDDLRIKQVLLNILSNAIKFTERGSITLEVGLDPDLAEFEQYIRFVIRDTGIGISDAAQTTLFESFQQADNTTTRKYGGTGLGLAISRQLVQLMGGELKLTSRLGHGSEFRFSIPLPPAQTIKRTGSDAQITVSNPDQFKNKHILLADDHPFNQQITTELLQAIGAEVTIANNGIEVIELARSTHFDAILMDVQMPEMDGITACQVLLHDTNWQQIPIIAMTANASTEDRQRCLKAGMVDFISKPIQPEKLYRILSQWLYRDQPAPPEGFSSAAETTNNATQTAFIDNAFMHSMLGDDPMRQRRYFAKFAKAMQEGLETISAHSDTPQNPVIGQECHRLKSVARTVGAMSLGEHLDEIEQQLPSLSPEQFLARLQATQQLFKAICHYLNESGLLAKPTQNDTKETSNE